MRMKEDQIRRAEERQRARNWVLHEEIVGH